MKFFADTANINEINYCFSRGVNDGITTNPKIMELTGDLSLGFEGACKALISKYPNVPISLETDLGGLSISEMHANPQKVKDMLLKQAYHLASLGKNVVIKIPICEGGLMAAKVLVADGIKTNITACMNPYQALEAAKTNSTYISLFANRMLDSNILELAGHNLENILKTENWKEVLKKNKESYFEEAWKRTLNQISYVAEHLEGKKSQLIVGSIRLPEDIYRLILAEPQVITIPTKIVEGLKDISLIKKTKRSVDGRSAIIGKSICHPMTDYTLEEFERAADTYRSVPIKKL